ncbi:hypothetical protein WJX84_010440 [Apatococcus fuscideae]|uniref:SMP-30/Gluconolactonase/LRE-like region domain-containing protein n=1 Tax=Apatococcus fuscideae TaxID=2026836 RepID=A0AAW1T7Z0_9CHLO
MSTSGAPLHLKDILRFNLVCSSEERHRTHSSASTSKIPSAQRQSLVRGYSLRAPKTSQPRCRQMACHAYGGRDATVELALDISAVLGEGPTWLDEQKRLAFVDIEGKRIHIWDPVSDELDTISTEAVGRPSTLTPSREGNFLVVAIEQSVYLVDIQKKKVGEKLAEVPYELQRPCRFNDGKASPVGTLVVGTMHDKWVEGEPAQMFKLGGKPMGPHSLEQVMTEDELMMGNGLVWTEDMKSMWHCDTTTNCINEWRCDRDGAPARGEDGKLDRLNQICIPKEEGSPDGMTNDAEGNLWVALFGGSAIACYSPQTGEQLRKVHIPVEKVTCPIFGGAELDTIYVTTAKIGLDDIPGAGGIFAVKIPGIKGKCPAYTANVAIRD